MVDVIRLDRAIVTALSRGANYVMVAIEDGDMLISTNVTSQETVVRLLTKAMLETSKRQPDEVEIICGVTGHA